MKGLQETFVLWLKLLCKPNTGGRTRLKWLSSSSSNIGGLAAQSSPSLATPSTVAQRAPRSMGFPRQDYWSGIPFPSPGDLPDLGIQPGSPALQADSLSTETAYCLIFHIYFSKPFILCFWDCHFWSSFLHLLTVTSLKSIFSL